MRGLTFATAVALTLEFTVSATGHAAETAPKTVNTNMPYPSQVSLMHERSGWTYRKSSVRSEKAGLPLYFSDADSPGKSVCYGECAMRWVPLIAPATEKSLGQWTIVVRTDGLLQWAFKGRPIYTHISDTPENPTGDGDQGTWHLMPHFLL